MHSLDWPVVFPPQGPTSHHIQILRICNSSERKKLETANNRWKSRPASRERSVHEKGGKSQVRTYGAHVLAPYLPSRRCDRRDGFDCSKSAPFSFFGATRCELGGCVTRSEAERTIRVMVAGWKIESNHVQSVRAWLPTGSAAKTHLITEPRGRRHYRHCELSPESSAANRRRAAVVEQHHNYWLPSVSLKQ